jgi:hypothetical protein
LLAARRHKGVRRLVAVLSISFTVAIGAISTVGAKGRVRGFNFDGYSVPGQRLSSVELLDDHGRRLMKSTPYFAYLENMDDAWINFRWPSPPLDESIRLGRVDLRSFRYRGEWRVEARLSFVVPEVPAGLYEVVVCNAGCAHKVLRLGPAGLYIVSGTVERRLRAEIDRVYTEVWDSETDIWRLEGRLRRSLRRLRSMEGRLFENDRELLALRERLPERTRNEDSSPVAAALVGAAAGAIAHAGVGLARSQRRTRR